VQIREHIRELIARSELVPGMRLPPVRSLATQLKVNQITVAKAYRELADAHLIEGRRGGGSFVRAPMTHAAPDYASEDTARPLLAERLFELARAPGVIAFSSNYPNLDRAGIEEFRESLNVAMGESLNSCFEYDPPLGRPALREQMVTYLAGQGLQTHAENVLITSGGQQAIDLAVRALVAPGDPVIIEQPAYYGAINALRDVKARILEAPLLNDGLDLDVVENHLRRERVRLIYTNPTFQNPTGITTSEQKRRDLLALARRYRVAILEDDHSPELRFKGATVPAIRALAEEDDLVLYARGLGKVFLPGMRLGFLVMPDILRRRLLTAKAHADLHSNNIIQEAAAIHFGRGAYAKSLDRMKNKYAANQKRLYESLIAGMPDGTVVRQPEGGLSLWLTLPEDAEVSELYFRAVQRGVAFVSGNVFYSSQARSQSLRISFGLNTSDELEEGVKRLCSVVRDLSSRRNARNLVMM
jgi:2-aminoadipate transaminase